MSDREPPAEGSAGEGDDADGGDKGLISRFWKAPAPVEDPPAPEGETETR